MTIITYEGLGQTDFDRNRAGPGGRLRRYNRFSITSAGEYVAIMEINLPEGVALEVGNHTLPLRLFAGEDLEIGKDYEIRDPINIIGSLKMIELKLEAFPPAPRAK